MTFGGTRSGQLLRGALASATIAVVSCARPVVIPPIEVSSWGTMREVLRDGDSRGRVALDGLASSTCVGIGALAGLAGEVTIVDGRVLVATADTGAREGDAPSGARVGEAAPADSASLLVLAEVPAWTEVPLGTVPDYAALDDAIARVLRERQAAMSEACPVRIRGRASHLELHVIAGACPIAHPDGPKPFRQTGAVESVELVGFYVEGAAGRLTHHHRRSHLHAVAANGMGHLDEVTLEDAVLLIPAAG